MVVLINQRTLPHIKEKYGIKEIILSKQPNLVKIVNDRKTLTHV